VPPGNRWLWRIGNGFTMSKKRKRTKAAPEKKEK